MADNLLGNLKEQTVDTRSSLGKIQHIQKIPEMQYWVRLTYYTPPKDKQSKIAPGLYGVNPASNLSEKLLKASFATCNDTNEGNIICPHGWKSKDSQFFNVISEEHFCCRN